MTDSRTEEFRAAKGNVAALRAFLRGPTSAPAEHEQTEEDSLARRIAEAAGVDLNEARVQARLIREAKRNRGL
jgi:hypothetical protein